MIDYSNSFPDHFTVPPGATVAAVMRNNHQEDIFAVGRDGIMYTKFVLNDDPWNGRWISLSAPANTSFPPGGPSFPPGWPVAAVKRSDDQEDIFAVGDDGIAYTRFVKDNNWNGQWIPL